MLGIGVFVGGSQFGQDSAAGVIKGVEVEADASLRVRVERVDAERRHLDLTLVDADRPS